MKETLDLVPTTSKKCRKEEAEHLKDRKVKQILFRGGYYRKGEDE
jgi:hypothetical protein